MVCVVLNQLQECIKHHFRTTSSFSEYSVIGFAGAIELLLDYVCNCMDTFLTLQSE